MDEAEKSRAASEAVLRGAEVTSHNLKVTSRASIAEKPSFSLFFDLHHRSLITLVCQLPQSTTMEPCCSMKIPVQCTDQMITQPWCSSTVSGSMEVRVGSNELSRALTTSLQRLSRRSYLSAQSPTCALFGSTARIIRDRASTAPKILPTCKQPT